MASRDMYVFWRKSRNARGAIATGDEAEDFFTAEVDRAFAEAAPPGPEGWAHALRRVIGGRSSRRPR